MTLKEWCKENNKIELLDQWDYKRNNENTPDNNSPFTSKKAWWICVLGHNYQAPINKRTIRGNSCPYCSGHKVLQGFNDLATTNPNLSKEWNYDKNGDKTPFQVSKGHESKVWWKCKEGHEWQASVNSRVSHNTGCPFCSGIKPIIGKNDLATTHPILIKEWDYNKNSLIKPSDFKSGSNKKVWWICDKGHEYQSTICARTLNRNGCPYCSNHKLLIGFNDFATLNPDIAKEWDYKNNLIKPTEIINGCNKNVWWICKNGHRWQAKVSSRVSLHTGCPFCSGNDVIKGFNDLVTTNSSLVAEWHPTKNIKITPYEVSKGCNKRVWWLGKCGHEWLMSVNARVRGCSCPYCAGKKILIGFNDLATLRPDLAKQWHPSKNGSLKPTDFAKSSNKTAWWICSKGHEWQSSINNRSNRDDSCPYCSNRSVLKGFNDLETVYPPIAQEWNYEKNTFKPSEVVYGSGKPVWWKCYRCGHEWKQSPAIRTRLLTGCPKCKNDSQISRPEKAIAYYLSKAGIEIEENYILFKNYSIDILIPSKKIGIEYDGQKWHQNRDHDIYKNQLCKEHNIFLYRIREPELADLNDYSYDIKIEKLTYDLSYMNSVILTLFNLLGITYNDIDVKRDDIEILSYMQLCKKKNSFLETDIDIAKEWNYKKNKDLNPSYFSRGSDVKVWWTCPKGHDYKASISSRARGTGCPYCANKKVLYGFNDFATQNPLLVNEWNYDKNTLLPTDVTSSSNKKIWWKCTNGHEWQESVYIRTKQNSGCPYCSGRKVLSGFNDLTTTYPEIAKEWDYSKNSIDPTKITAGSNKIVWWKCSKCGHEWEVSPAHRIQGRGCPKCGIEKFITSRRLNRIKLNGSFADNYPELASEWDYERNNLSPNEVEKSSNKKIWWICSKGHRYESSINSRVSANCGCPYCSNHKVLKGFNDLATLFPNIAKEWDYNKNGSLTPEMVTKGSNKKIWWICSNGHSFESSVNSRVCGHHSCPYCSNHKVLTGFNDLLTITPDLAAEWNYDKNDGLTPEMFTPGSNKKVWWKCKLGHEWETTICLRTLQKTRCPYCTGKKILKGYNDLETVFPSLALEWDFEKNIGLSPDELVPGSGKIVAWKCPKCGHEWTSSVVNRTKKKSGCTKCRYNWYSTTTE